MTKKEIEEIVYDYPRQYKEGFKPEEVDELLTEHFEGINRAKYHETLWGSSGVMRDGHFITFPHDVVLGIKCALDNRPPNIIEWD